MRSRHPVLATVIRVVERVVGRPRLAKFARLLSMEVMLDGPNDIASNGEAIVQRLAREQRDGVVFDVGAHFGEWSLAFLEQVGGPTQIHAFEPSSATAQRARAALASQATVHQCALSDTVGERALYIVHEMAGSNSLVASVQALRAATAIETVQVDTVDDVALRLGIDHLTLLKIDAEGNDLAVIRGARRMLSDAKIDMVQFEYNWRWVEARCFLLDAFRFFEECDYRLGKVTPRGVEVYHAWDPELETFREGNYLAFKPALSATIPQIAWWGP